MQKKPSFIIIFATVASCNIWSNVDEKSEMKYNFKQPDCNVRHHSVEYLTVFYLLVVKRKSKISCIFPHNVFLFLLRSQITPIFSPWSLKPKNEKRHSQSYKYDMNHFLYTYGTVNVLSLIWSLMMDYYSFM